MALQSTTALATITLQADAANVTFSGIPSTYRDLIIVATARDVYAASGDDSFALQFNGDSSSSYSFIRMYATSTARTVSSYSGQTSLPSGRLNEGNTTAGRYSTNIIQILDYSATDKHKPVNCRANVPTVVYNTSGRWANTAAIHTVTLFAGNGTANLAAGCTVALYGRIA